MTLRASPQELRARVTQLRRQLHLETACTLQDVIAAIERDRQCRIEIVLHDMEGSTLYGACTATRDAFIIAVRHDASRLQRMRIVCHELVHILRGDVILGQPMRVCRDEDMADPRERETEEMAHLLAASLRSMAQRRNAMGAGLDRFWEEMGGRW